MPHTQSDWKWEAWIEHNFRYHDVPDDIQFITLAMHDLVRARSEDMFTAKISYIFIPQLYRIAKARGISSNQLINELIQEGLARLDEEQIEEPHTLCTSSISPNDRDPRLG